MSDFKIIPGHEGHSVPGPVTGVEEGDGVLAVNGACNMSNACTCVFGLVYDAVCFAVASYSFTNFFI